MGPPLGTLASSFQVPCRGRIGGADVIEVKSYLRGPDEQFTGVDAVTNSPLNPRYVERAIELTIDGVSIIDTVMWDHVDQPWAYISDMVLSLQEQEQAITYFPDQPIKL
jgi:hypothetical protein